MEPVPTHIAGLTRPVDRLMTYYVLAALMTLPAFPVTVLVLYFRSLLSKTGDSRCDTY